MAVAGNFCSGCGSSLAARTCSACQARLSPQARFCHRCGHPAGLPRAGSAAPRRAARERTAWLVAVGLCLVLLGAIVFKVLRGVAPAAAPDMANPGAGAPGGPGAAPAAAPDISRMTPRERFDRLFNRVMRAADQADTAQIERFLPMALAAYSQLDSTDVDARYHAAVLHLQTGEASAALALADTILASAPGHLFGYLVQGEAARRRHDSTALARAEHDFLSHYDAETEAKRVEYLEHQPAIEEFRKEAEKREERKEKQ
jgi:double zinc ribbon protein